MMEKQHIVILGAGPCGLSAAWQLQKRTVPSFHVYEAAPHAGGLSTSFIDEKGFTWDIGGHVFHGINESIQAVFRDMTQGKYNTYVRHASVLIGDTFVSYPFQYAIPELPTDIREACIRGVQEKKQTAIPDSFYAWILQTFGSGMARYFFFPYNKKMWHYPLKKMGWQWIHDKIATTSGKQKGTAWGRNAQFSVPTVGGIGSIFTEMANTLSSRISYNKQAVGVDAKKHIVTFSDSSSVHYDHLFSTIPLPTLTQMTTGMTVPSTNALASCGVMVVGIGMRGKVPEKLRDTHWIYIPSSTIPFFRVSVYSNYGESQAPSGTWSLLFEVSYDGKKSLNKDVLTDRVIASAVACGFIPSQADIIDRFYVKAPLAYPIPTKNRDTILSRVIPALEKSHIFSRGRFGSWKYETGNMDQVMAVGIAWVDEILGKNSV